MPSRFNEPFRQMQKSGGERDAVFRDRRTESPASQRKHKPAAQATNDWFADKANEDQIQASHQKRFEIFAKVSTARHLDARVPLSGRLRPYLPPAKCSP